MDLKIHNTFLPHTDPEESMAFYRDVLGFEVLNDVGYQGMRWITVGPQGKSGTQVVLYPPAANPGITDEETRVIGEMMAKGTFANLILSAGNVDEAFDQIQAAGAEVVQEPVDQPYGVRDCAFRDPAGNLIRVVQQS